MKLVEYISKQELQNIKEWIGEAFVTNELFHEFGSIEERREFVLQYMNCYVQYVYDTKSLYSNEEQTAFIGLCYSKDERFWPKIKMLWNIIRAVPFDKLKRMLKQVKENTSGNEIYTKYPYLEVLMVCVKKSEQGKGLTHELVDFAKDMAVNYHCPILFDTDMKDYANIYQHYGCNLYNQCTAANGVTRYNLIWDECS